MTWDDLLCKGGLVRRKHYTEMLVRAMCAEGDICLMNEIREENESLTQACLLNIEEIKRLEQERDKLQSYIATEAAKDFRRRSAASIKGHETRRARKVEA